MRDIEVAALSLNNVKLRDGRILSAPRIDWTWGFPGRSSERDWRDNPPYRRDSDNIRRLLRLAPWLPQIAFPHVVAVFLGVALFTAAAADAPGMDTLHP
jgi:hypothetical protein